MSLKTYLDLSVPTNAATFREHGMVPASRNGKVLLISSEICKKDRHYSRLYLFSTIIALQLSLTRERIGHRFRCRPLAIPSTA